MHRAACGIGVMQLPALLSPSATLPWPLVVMDFVSSIWSWHTQKTGCLPRDLLFRSIFAIPGSQMVWVKFRFYPHYDDGDTQGFRGDFNVDGNGASQPSGNFRASA